MSRETDRRLDSRASVDLYMNRYLDGEPYLCRATDISRSGMRLEPLHEPEGAHRFMGLQFQLPGSDRVITASAEAVSLPAGRGVGIRLTRIAPEHLAIIDRYAKAA